MAKVPQIIPLLLEEMAAKQGATHVIEILAAHLTTATVTTAQVFTFPTVAGKGIFVPFNEVPAPFSSSGDPAFDSVTAKVGNNAAVDTFSASHEIGTAAASKPIHFGTANKQVTTAPDTLKVTIAPKTGKALAALDSGVLKIYVTIL